MVLESRRQFVCSATLAVTLAVCLGPAPACALVLSGAPASLRQSTSAASCHRTSWGARPSPTCLKPATDKRQKIHVMQVCRHPLFLHVTFRPVALLATKSISAFTFCFSSSLAAADPSFRKRERLLCEQRLSCLPSLPYGTLTMCASSGRGACFADCPHSYTCHTTGFRGHLRHAACRSYDFQLYHSQHGPSN